jgi:hypothetical protein
MNSINCQSLRPSRRMNSAHNFMKKEEKKGKIHSLRSLSLSDQPVVEIDKKSKIQQLEQKLLEQTQKLQKLELEKEKLLNNQEEIQAKELKIFKKNNFLNLKNSSEDSKQKSLKIRSEELNKQCEELIKTLENLSKSEKNLKGKEGQVEKDLRVNKELRALMKVMKNKLLFAKAKHCIKKQLRAKQSRQIESMEKIVEFLVNKVESLEENAVLTSVDLNNLKNRKLLDTGLSVCNLKDYFKGKNQQISSQIIEEKQNLEVFQGLCQKNTLSPNPEIKKTNQEVLSILLETEKSLEKEEVLKEKRQILENLQEMLKFWIQEYSRVSLATHTE